MIALLLKAVALGLAFCTFAASFGWLFWPFSLLEHFRWQYALIGLLIFLGLMFVRSRLWPLTLVLALFNGLAVVANGSFGTKVGTEGPTLRILHANIDRHNTDLSDALDFVAASDADIVFLQEMTPDALPQFERTLEAYELLRAEARTDSKGSAMFKRRTADFSVGWRKVLKLPDGSDRPLLAGFVRWNGGAFRIMSAHVTRPQHGPTVRAQRREMRAIGHWAKGSATVAVGDFNATPWSSPMDYLLDDSDLLVATAGWPRKPTWPSGWPRAFQLPLNHVIHSSDLFVRDVEIGPDIGSDHLPLMFSVGRTETADRR